MFYSEWLLYLLIPTIILAHLFYSPYTKVEESFNIQAIHDILIHGIPWSNTSHHLAIDFDHVSFPGSVPRTFAGALMLAGLSRPFLSLLSSPNQLQLLVRSIIGLANAAALVSFSTSVRRAFGKNAQIWFLVFQASQFHIIYYASRTLPNSFALLFSTLALRSFLVATSEPPNQQSVSKHYRLCLYLLTVAGVVFRSELAILIGTITLYLVIRKRVSIPRTVLPAGLSGAAVGLLISVPVDSFFWQTFPLWPEWTAFYYNTIEGHSTDWGTSPWHFYFLNALPRLLLNPVTYLLCIPLSIAAPATRQRSLDLIIPLLGFVGLYSFLPHKEWRFIIYIIPGLTAVAGAGASWIWTRKVKSQFYRFLSLALIASILASFAASTALLAISSLNYPGGAALARLHQITDHEQGSFRVHLDNLACQTGITRFLEKHNPPQSIEDVLVGPHDLAQKGWVYDKTEDPSLLLDPSFWSKFDFVLAEKPEKAIGKWQVVDIVYGFAGVRILRPGEESGRSAPEALEALGISEPADETREYGALGKFSSALESTVRYRITRGWWAEVKMEPRIRILANLDRRYEGTW
ncbi:glycosyltransferase family 22 protein [Lepidopterella palustris CBS 459.81]|uniref:Mannosyltransferase n=1 Tax=Lepidopterella palustris CBS 459.81 TaxID=1314670 RepID=A0A8E2JDD4_9PEZI|nr:glycosyltransferase family 22 protein [Lepidopterella palustris CBS 459.81]